MLLALAADFAAIPGVAVTLLWDARLPSPESILSHSVGNPLRDVPELLDSAALTARSSPPLPEGEGLIGCSIELVHSREDELHWLQHRAANYDWTVVIAPEFDNLLHARCRWVEQSGGRLLGPSSRIVELTADKQRTADWLNAHGVPAPRGMVIEPNESSPPRGSYPSPTWRGGEERAVRAAAIPIRFPAVLKPQFGAGSQSTYLVRSQIELTERLTEFAGPARLETWIPGLAASVAFVCGPVGQYPLLPCRQQISTDDRFRYLGGALPMSNDLSRRAISIAARALATLPDLLGYCGVDLILGEDSTGRDDAVIEINPRLTTSYIGLRQRSHKNLAGVMLAVAGGEKADLSFARETLEFNADGTISHGIL